MEMVFSAVDSPRWRQIRQYPFRPAPAWRRWLLEPGSLTRTLRALSHDDFRVDVLEECWLTVPVPLLRGNFPDHMLRQRMWSRKVVLRGCGEPWVMAHSLVPQSSLDGPLRSLTRLNNKPLGAFLFRHRHLQRSSPQVLFHDNIWGRRSVFRLAGQPLLVAEFFTPALIARARSRKGFRSQ